MKQTHHFTTKNGLYAKIVQLELGKEYKLFRYSNPKRYRFIKVTRCGYNFLDIEKHKCVSRTHFYPVKNTKRTFFENAFMVPANLTILKGKEETDEIIPNKSPR
jgi:hypothetical protein